MSLFGRRKGNEDAAKERAGTRSAPDLEDLQLPEGAQDQAAQGERRDNSQGNRGQETRGQDGRNQGGARTPPGRGAASGVGPGRMQGDSMARSDNQTTGFRPELPKRPVSEIPGMRPPGSDQGSRSSGSGTDPKTLIVGKEISLNGEISSCDRLIVEGKVEASLADCHFIEIADGGIFKGAAEIRDAEIRGLFEGKLTVQGRLLICATGRVVGEVRYGQIEIECGGEVSGTIDKALPGQAARIEYPAPVAAPTHEHGPEHGSSAAIPVGSTADAQ